MTQLKTLPVADQTLKNWRFLQRLIRGTTFEVGFFLPFTHTRQKIQRETANNCCWLMVKTKSLALNIFWIITNFLLFLHTVFFFLFSLIKWLSTTLIPPFSLSLKVFTKSFTGGWVYGNYSFSFTRSLSLSQSNSLNLNPNHYHWLVPRRAFEILLFAKKI